MPTLTSSTGGADSDTRIVSPMPLAQQRPEGDGRLDRALEGRARLGDAEVQRPVAAPRRAARRPCTMTTGSLCFTEILKSWKSCSSNSDASQTADSTSASGVALPYFSSSRGSREPALTPIRIETPASLAAWAISLTWSSNWRMLPGLTRTPAHPASIAAKTYFGWKWMSAMTGICDLRAIAGSASASSWLGQATRTMSQPAAVSSAICCSVALTSDGEGRRHGLHADRGVPSDEHLADPDLAGPAARSEHGRRQGGQSEVDGHALSIVRRRRPPTRHPRAGVTRRRTSTR